MKIFFKGLFIPIKILTIFGWIGLLVIFILPALPVQSSLQSYAIITGSMEPHIPKGAIVMVDQSKNAPKVGEIYAFQSPQNQNETIIHRVYAVQENGLIKTKGDNNESVDTWTLTPQMLKGQAIAYIPYLGGTSSFIRTPFGIIVLLIIPALFGTIKAIKNIIEGIQELRTPKDKNRKTKLHHALISSLLIAYTVAGNATPALAAYTDTVLVNNIRITMLPKEVCEDIIRLYQSGTSSKITVTTTISGGTTKVVINNQSNSSSQQKIHIFQKKTINRHNQ